ncbi:hypothetical protein HN51_040375, partial [Arachis hypogaea]
MKRKTCAELGIKSFDIDLPEQVSKSNLIKQVHQLNVNPDVHGILVYLPLPKHINEEKVLSEISLDEDSGIMWKYYNFPIFLLIESSTATIKEQMAYDTKHLRVLEIQWLGAYPLDTERYFIPKQCLLSLIAEARGKNSYPCANCQARIFKRYDAIPSGTLYPNADEIKYLQRLVIHKACLASNVKIILFYNFLLLFSFFKCMAIYFIDCMLCSMYYSKDSATMVLNNPPKLPVKFVDHFLHSSSDWIHGSSVNKAPS